MERINVVKRKNIVHVLIIVIGEVSGVLGHRVVIDNSSKKRIILKVFMSKRRRGCDYYYSYKCMN